MDWFKVKVKYCLYSDLKDASFATYIKLMALTAEIECIPTEQQMLKICHYKTLKNIQGYFKKHSTSLQEVLNKVLIDVQEVNTKRLYWKEVKQAQRCKNEIVHKDILEKSHHRLDKIRLDKNNKRETTRFIKPTIDEIKTYILEIKSAVNGEQFFDYYESKGWKIGSAPMKDWKAAVRTWTRKEPLNNKSKDIRPKVESRPTPQHIMDLVRKTIKE